MKHIRLKSDPQAQRIRISILEERITTLLCQLSDARRERDTLQSELNRLHCDADSEAWKTD